ncbi:Aldo/keto reductase [Bimuria novae-zelandiae CBS 107.79]|uniref:Aldo/keto reductase n=1 Tax=Bimuria novae-zelandiae CBS 107.79 TaxID=1447943 RepID=A0A6A5V5X1_9PLEO|nr:Aldo/keto reductase [Bimuria novae-zelandiae CBS 107.79]
MRSPTKAASKLVSNELSWEVPFIYVQTAIAQGHYQEPLVGDALRDVFKNGSLKRGDIYDLTIMLYDPSAPLATQIHTSVASSLRNLRPNDTSEKDAYIDCLLLHSPLPTIDQTLEAWKTLESYVPHKIRTLGISNTTLQILQAIHDASNIKPAVVQNRFYPQTNYDVPLRSFCDQHDITYQSFWTLTGNRHLLESEVVKHCAGAVGVAAVSKHVALYALVMDLGIVMLNGTTSAKHMGEDIRDVREFAMSHEKEQERIRNEFRKGIEK